MLRPGTFGGLLIAIAAAGLGCGAPAPPSLASGYTISAQWSTDDDSVVVLNVVVAAATDRRGLPDAARALRDRHPRSRVIVTFFADAAGPERYVVGHVPVGDEPVVTEPRGPAWLTTFDFPRPAATPRFTATAGVP